MQIHESAEKYLEAILMLSKRKPHVRSVDVANELDFRKSSVSVAMKSLRENGYITVDDAGFLYLTEKGLAIAEVIFERHEWLSNWFVSLGVDPDIAVEDACRMEHVISPETFAALKERYSGEQKQAKE